MSKDEAQHALYRAAGALDIIKGYTEGYHASTMAEKVPTRREFDAIDLMLTTALREIEMATEEVGKLD